MTFFSLFTETFTDDDDDDTSYKRDSLSLKYKIWDFDLVYFLYHTSPLVAEFYEKQLFFFTHKKRNDYFSFFSSNTISAFKFLYRVTTFRNLRLNSPGLISFIFHHKYFTLIVIYVQFLEAADSSSFMILLYNRKKSLCRKYSSLLCYHSFVKFYDRACPFIIFRILWIFIYNTQYV